LLKPRGKQGTRGKQKHLGSDLACMPIGFCRYFMIGEVQKLNEIIKRKNPGTEPRTE
jgi:hypothetical protein